MQKDTYTSYLNGIALQQALSESEYKHTRELIKKYLDDRFIGKTFIKGNKEYGRMSGAFRTMNRIDSLNRYGLINEFNTMPEWLLVDICNSLFI